MRFRTSSFFGAVLAALAFSVAAQEPQPARINASSLNTPDGAILNFAWRFAPGDAPGRALPQFDDSRWLPVRPRHVEEDCGPGGWSGVGWFRRHLLVDPALQQHDLVLRFESAGAADIYLDGRLVLSANPAAQIPFDRRDAVRVRMAGPAHLLAVRLRYPSGVPPPAGGLGFDLAIAKTGAAPAEHFSWIEILRGDAPVSDPRVTVVEGGILVLPIFLALLHLALFVFDPRARENLFYAGEVIAFEAILLNDFGVSFMPSAALRGAIAQGGAAAAILFGTLTFYAVRTKPFPRSWRVLVGAGLAAFAASYLLPAVQQPVWVAYFCLMIAEILRLEFGGRTLLRDGAAKFFLLSFAIFTITIIVQILVNYGLLELAGIHAVYVIGILVSAVGMSLYLARRMGQSRVIEAEDKRKSEELAQARALQLSMLPRVLPEARGLDLAPMTQTAAEVGGDYYDVRADGEGGLLFAFGDATGHGLASGIVVTAAKALFNSLPAGGSPGEMLERCDRSFRGMQLPLLRMCLALARVTPAEAVAASAAMPPILIHRRATGCVEELGAGGLPLGSRIESRYEECRAPLHFGDTLLFASDGLAELLDPAGRPFGYQAVASAFREAAAASSAREVIERLQSAASRFRGARPLSDDITLLAVRVQG